MSDVVDDAGIAELDDAGRDDGREVVDDVGRHPVGRDGAQRVEVRRAARSTGQPGSPCQAGRSIVPRAVPCASISDVIVSGPTQVIRAGQISAAVEVA